MRLQKISLHVVCLCLLFFLPLVGMAASRDFVVVIDAGHGGKDPGAVGRKAREKVINLNVALALGKLIENNCPDTRVVYTRQTDVFLSLDKRARIANKAKADLFISIHTNALPKGRIARGTETYTLGMHRANDKLEVAQRENAVILVEENYKERYAGFNPKSAESYIVFEFMQDKHMEQSVSLAKLIQSQFRSYAKRVDKGVHQAGFLVLRETSMPSVLVELGYISTPDEETYLNSKKGVEALSRSIYNAFVAYKDSQMRPKANIGKSPTVEVTENQAQAEVEKKSIKADGHLEEEKNLPVFKLQILSTSSPLPAGSSRLKGVKAFFYKENGLYKYTYGETTDYNEIMRLKRKMADKFKDAFVVAFKGTEKINIQEAVKEFKEREQKE
ncbi:MAG: N-acetylmuramoyl-L-alanine amidase [Bacteroidaceae bacterium]|nr:N-acetylmuramoyl-L-alanine amidase [Bacteroidaceae bacterium]